MNATDTSPNERHLAGDACGFKLSLLGTLGQIKGFDNRTSVLRYLVMECIARDKLHSQKLGLGLPSDKTLKSHNSTDTNGSVLQWCAASTMPMLHALPEHSTIDALSASEKEFMSFDQEFRSLCTTALKAHLQSLREQNGNQDEEVHHYERDGDPSTTSSNSPHPHLNTLSSLHSTASHHNLEEEPLLAFFFKVESQNNSIKALFAQARNQGTRLKTYLCEDELTTEQVIDCIRKFKLCFEMEMTYLKKEEKEREMFRKDRENGTDEAINAKDVLDFSDDRG